MNTVVPISSDDERLKTASRWVVRLEEGLSESEEQSLREWLVLDPANVTEFLNVARVCDKMDDLSRLANLFPRDQERLTSWSQRVYVVAVASLLAVAVLTFWLAPSYIDSGEVAAPVQTVVNSTLHYETEIGEQSTVTLPDGTVVTLNTSSNLSVAYTAAARVLRLHRGEIHVNVASDATRPLSVLAGDRVVQAVGTTFSVEIVDGDSVDVVVTEGKVVVGIHAPVAEHGDSLRVLAPQLLVQTDSNTVTAGQEILLGAPGQKVTPISAEDIEVKLSWRDGRLIFRGETLEEALAEVGRYTTIEFVFLDDELKLRSITGRFRAGDVEALLVALQLNFDIRYEFATENRVLLSKL